MGFYNVDAMLASAPAGQLMEWREYYELEPFGESWRQTSTIAASICNEIRVVAAGFKTEGATESDFYELDEFVPGVRENRVNEALQSKLEAADALEGFGF